MATNSLQIDDHSSQVKGREARTQSIATRFTRAEEQALLKRAEASGKNLREWARDELKSPAFPTNNQRSRIVQLLRFYPCGLIR